MKKLTKYYADMGSVRINGVNFGNGVGDGCFDVYFTKTLQDGFTLMSDDIWFDLRGGNTIAISQSDCDNGHVTTLTADALGCSAVRIARDDFGNIALVEYF